MNLKETAIIVAITILFSAFVIFTIEAFYPRPQYENFCNLSLEISTPVNEPANCTFNYDAETNCYKNEGMPKYKYDESGCRYVAECDYCQKDYNTSLKEYNQVLFYILAIIGVLAIIFGIYYKIDFIGTGFMFSGIFLLFFGTMQNFNELNRYVRPLVLFLELGLILFIAYKKIVNKK